MIQNVDPEAKAMLYFIIFYIKLYSYINIYMYLDIIY